eukprot:GHVS01006098.1.p1 GENE.GHVS01006098.1~~GHVS01006098.1.p1  ORF type:complete len:568 (+),score=99.60 GHVS01006098.1:169-1872(+)
MLNNSNSIELPTSSTMLPEGSVSLDAALRPGSSPFGRSVSSLKRDYKNNSSCSSTIAGDSGPGSTVMSSYGSGGLLCDSADTPSTTTSCAYGRETSPRPHHFHGPSYSSCFSTFSLSGHVSGEDSPIVARANSFDDSPLSVGGTGASEMTMEALKSVRKKLNPIPFGFKVALVFIILMFIPCWVLLRSSLSSSRSSLPTILRKDRSRAADSCVGRHKENGAGGEGCGKSVLDGEDGEVAVSSLRRGLKLYEWTSATEHDIKTHKIKTFMLLFYDFSIARESFSSQEEKKHMEETRALLHKSAAQFASRDILHIGVPLEKLHDFQFFLGDEPEKDVPFAMIVEVKNGWRKFRLANTPTVATINVTTTSDTHVSTVGGGGSGTLTPSQLMAFEHHYLQGQLSPWLRSELPLQGSVTSVVVAGRQSRAMTSPGVVQQIVGSQFLKNVMETKVDSLVFFFAPWCGHCKFFESGFADLAMKFKDIRSIDFIKMDATRNDIDHPSVRVERVPYVRFFKAGSKRSGGEPIAFSHSEKNIVTYGTEFLKANSTCPFDLVANRDNCSRESQAGVEL